MHNHKDWLYISQEDLKLAKVGVKLEEAILLPTLFLCHQAAEKALKGYLIAMEVKVQKTHNLPDLLRKCMEFNEVFGDLKEEVINLNPYITKSRYPDDVFMIPSIMLAEKCIQDAEKVINFVLDELSKYDL